MASAPRRSRRPASCTTCTPTTTPSSTWPPLLADLDVRGHGIEYVRPEVQMASIFDDGTALTIHTDMDKTLASMARFSEKDAATFERLYGEAHGFIDLLLGTLMYQPPLNVKDLTKALGTFGVEDRSEFLSVKLRRQTINEFLDRHFDNDRIKAHLAFHGAVCSYTNDVAGLASATRCWSERSTTGTCASAVRTAWRTPCGATWRSTAV
ncbi:MAG: hypothetical protein M5U19_21295 [Microthrixaceae bacterium]|nr:hypothetical protein [Microthrixaceae bacterium]